MNRYTDKIALVTSGTSGMGLATARRLIDEGAQVVITGRTDERVRAAAADLGPRATDTADLSAVDLSAVDAMADTVTARFGRLDLVSPMRAPALSPRSPTPPKRTSTRPST